jgi:hypothetical protein
MGIFDDGLIFNHIEGQTLTIIARERWASWKN